MNIPMKKFEDMVLGAAARIVASLPPGLRSRAQAVIFAVADRPTPEQIRSVGDDEDAEYAGDLLGLYEGTSLIDRGIDDTPLVPDRITLFRVPFADMCGNDRELREEIRLTIIHELGHFFGFEEGDLVEIPKPAQGLGRIAAQIAKQVIIQRVRDAERERVYENYIDKENCLITGTVKRYEDKAVVFEIGEAEAYLLPREQVRNENYSRGERMRLLVLKVGRGGKEPQIQVSRAHPDVIRRLFELEVPEVYEGTVLIRHIVREPGERTKIAVSSREPDVDPVGACVGMKGSRIMTIIKELRNEKIDIIEWADDPVDFAVNALSPAEIVRVLIKNPANRVMEVVVDNDNLSLAIGRKGQNVRLASRLIGWQIDIKSEEEKRREIEGEMASLVGFGAEEPLAEADAEGSTDPADPSPESDPVDTAETEAVTDGQAESADGAPRPEGGE